MKIEISVGTELLINGTKCAVVVDEEYPCGSCVFEQTPLCNHLACCDSERDDEKSIHFEKVI